MLSGNLGSFYGCKILWLGHFLSLSLWKKKTIYLGTNKVQLISYWHVPETHTPPKYVCFGDRVSLCSLGWLGTHDPLVSSLINAGITCLASFHSTLSKYNESD
jgi:hypothetical protein